MKRTVTACLVYVASFVAPLPAHAAGEDKPRVIRMTVSPAPEPIPALKYRFLPRAFEQKAGNAALLYYRMLDSANVLGWGFIAHDSDTYNANFVVRSPILLFEDDVYVQVKAISPTQSSLYVQSSSRAEWSRADFASNAGNIQRLIAKIRED